MNNKSLKTYDELTADQQETARELFPDDYREGEYHFNCAELAFRAKEKEVTA